MSERLETLLAEARRGEILPVYLFHGEPYALPRDAARRLIELIVPAKDRDFALSVHDGARARVADILDDARSLSLLTGRRAILVKDAPLFLSKRDAKKVVEACRERWEAAESAAERAPAEEAVAEIEPLESDGTEDEEAREPNGTAGSPLSKSAEPTSRHDAAEANRHRAAVDLLALLAAAGWSLASLADDTEEAAARWHKDFGIKLSERTGEWEEFSRWLNAVHAFCVERGMELPATAGEREALVQGIEHGLPPGNTLIFTCRKADPALGLYKAIENKGAAVALRIEERDAAGFTRTTVERVASALGVRIAPRALAMLEELLEPNPERIEQEIEKLAAFCGEGAEIQPAHVESAIEKTRQDPIYRLQEAVGERNLDLALGLLDESLLQGNLTPQLRALGALGALASAVRKMIRMRALVDGPLRGKMQSEPSYASFQSRILPDLIKDPRGASLKGRHPFGVWKDLVRARNFRAAELRAALDHLARADRALKLSPGDPRLIVEEALLRLLAPRGAG